MAIKSMTPSNKEGKCEVCDDNDIKHRLNAEVDGDRIVFYTCKDCWVKLIKGLEK